MYISAGKPIPMQYLSSDCTAPGLVTCNKQVSEWKITNSCNATKHQVMPQMPHMHIAELVGS